MRHCKEESVECVLLSPRIIYQTLRVWLPPPAEYLQWKVLASQLVLFWHHKGVFAHPGHSCSKSVRVCVYVCIHACVLFMTWGCKFLVAPVSVGFCGLVQFGACSHFLSLLSRRLAGSLGLFQKGFCCNRNKISQHAQAGGGEKLRKRWGFR